MAALLPFGKTSEFLSELLPLSAEVCASTVRNRTMRVGRRLQKSAEAMANAAAPHSCKAAVIGFDGGYVRARHRRPERNFEIVAGKVLAEDGSLTRFAFVRQGSSAGVSTADHALRRHGVNDRTRLTVLTDGDAGLRAIHHQLAPRAEHVLDWFHVSMRFQNLKQVAKGLHGLTDGALRRHALDQLERAKWHFWNGQVVRGLIGLVHLGQWARARFLRAHSGIKKAGECAARYDPLPRTKC